MQVIFKTYVLPVCNLTNVSRINEQRKLDLDYQRSCDPTRKKECHYFHETVMLGSDSSCSAAIVCIFKCLDWFEQT